MIRGLVLVLGMVACGGQDEHAHCRVHRCNAVPLAFEATAPIVEQVVADLREATGADVITDPYGVPVMFVPEVINPDNGERLCGLTLNARFDDGEVLWQEIRVATEATGGCGSLRSTLAHEMIHALAPDAKHVEDEGESVFASPSQAERFSQADVETVCSAIDCQR